MRLSVVLRPRGHLENNCPRERLYSCSFGLHLFTPCHFASPWISGWRSLPFARFWECSAPLHTLDAVAAQLHRLQHRASALYPRTARLSSLSEFLSASDLGCGGANAHICRKNEPPPALKKSAGKAEEETDSHLVRHTRRYVLQPQHLIGVSAPITQADTYDTQLLGNLSARYLLTASCGDLLREPNWNRGELGEIFGKGGARKGVSVSVSEI